MRDRAATVGNFQGLRRRLFIRFDSSTSSVAAFSPDSIHRSSTVASDPYKSVGAYVKPRFIGGMDLVASVVRGGMSFGPVPLPFALAINSVRPTDANAIGINSVGMKPLGSSIPEGWFVRRSGRVSRTATASAPRFARVHARAVLVLRERARLRAEESLARQAGVEVARTLNSGISAPFRRPTEIAATTSRFESAT